MKKKISFSLAALALVVLALGMFLKTNPEEEVPTTEQIAFITIGLDQNKLLNESSSYEIQRATEHFSDLILGWTVEPGFEFKSSPFTGRRQEKQNLLFRVESSEPGEAEELVNAIELRLNEYNTKTGAGYLIALERYSTVSVVASSQRDSFGFALLGFGLLGLCFFAWNYATRR